MAAIDPLLPDPAFINGAGGRPEAHCRRAIVDAIFYVVDNGIKWRALPADFPPYSTVFKYFTRWEAAGATELILDTLRIRVRLAEVRVAAPSAAIIDSASVRGAETVGADTRGYDAGKLVKRSDDTTGFTVLPRRWVVERTLAWIARHRRCVRDLRTAAGPPRSHGRLDNDQNHQQTLGQTG